MNFVYSKLLSGQHYILEGILFYATSTIVETECDETESWRFIIHD